MKRWYLLHTKLRQEARAQENLERQGYEVYWPRLLARKRVRGRWRDCVDPLFPRYLFVALDALEDNWAPIRSTLGVAALVRFGVETLPRPVDAQLIERLRGREEADGLARLSADLFRPGARVLLSNDAFDRVEALFDEPAGERRVYILLDLLGARHRIRVSEDDIVPA